MNRVKEDAGVKSKRYDPGKSEFDLHYLGLSAELAFCRITGLLPDFRVFLSGDNGHDFALPDGRTIELKYRTKRGSDFALVEPRLESMRADIGVLMWTSASGDGYEFVGWTDKEHARQVGMVKRLKRDRFLVRWQDLKSPQSFMRLLDGNE